LESAGEDQEGLMKNIGLLSIVIPVYNGADTIGRMVDKLIEILGADNLQIVLVNDGSRDRSDEVCRQIISQYPQIVTYINLSRNFGEHNAVMAGLNYARGDYAVIMDDDFQNPPEEVSHLLNEAVTNQYDIVYSYYDKKEDSLLRNLGSWFNNRVANFLLQKPRDLYLSSFKIFSKFVVREIVKYKGPFPYVDGLALRCTNKVGKVKVRHDKRPLGRSGYTLKKLLRLWLNMFINFSMVPLRISFFLGLIFSCLGLVLSIYIVVDKLMHPDIPMGWPSLIIAVMVFSGVQLLILGLIGEYLGHLLLNENRTPQFVVRDVFRLKGESE